MNMRGKSVWIIGASSGIGRALAVEMHKRGAKLVLSSRDEAALAKLKTESCPDALLMPLDVQDQAAIARVSDEIAVRLQLDSVVYMAGTYEPMSVEKLDLARTASIMAVNLMGPIAVTHAVLPAFLKRGAGQIALCASVAGYRGLPNAQPYGASKAALINFTESLRAEMTGRGVDIKLICPGFVKTPMTDKNKFPMPMMIGVEAAAQALADGLQGSAFEIHFPKKFTLLMKILQLLPNWLYFLAVRNQV